MLEKERQKAFSVALILSKYLQFQPLKNCPVTSVEKLDTGRTRKTLTERWNME